MCNKYESAPERLVLCGNVNWYNLENYDLLIGKVQRLHPRNFQQKRLPGLNLQDVSNYY